MSAELLPESRLDPSLSLPVRRPIGITMAVLAIVVFGFVSLRKLQVTLLPEIAYPTITVRTEFPGATPDDVEERVTRRLQEELATVPALVRIWSISRAETSDVLLEFDWGTPMTFAVQDVREKLNSVFLPEGAEQPILLHYDPNLDPILRIGVSGNLTLRELREYADKTIKEDLEGLDGVAAARVRGGDEKEYRISFRAAELRRRGLSSEQLSTLVTNANLNRTGGLLREGDTEYLVRTVNEFRSAEDIRELLLTLPGGQRIRLGDVAEVEITDREREVITRIDGRAAVEIAIYREAEANLVEVARRVRERVFGTAAQQAYVQRTGARYGADSLGAGDAAGAGGDRMAAMRARQEREALTGFLAFRLPEGVHLTQLTDQSRFVEQSTQEVLDAAMQGGLLAVIVLYLFLRQIAGTLIIALSIPISVIATFAPMYMAGVTMNIMSLGGLALGIGMLVDNSIVVLESIARCQAEGDPRLRAAVRGTREVGGAVIASTLTTVAVFFPIVFVEGIAGQMFGDQSIAVVSSLTVSLAVALFFIPVLVTLSAPGKPARPRTLPAAGDLFAGFRRTDGSRHVFRGALFLPRDLLLLAGRVLLALLALLSGLFVLVGGGLWRVLRFALDLVTNAFEFAYTRVAALYVLLLRASLRWRWTVLLLTLLLAAAAAMRVPRLGTQLMPDVYQGEFTLDFSLDVGTRLARTDDAMRAIESGVRALPDVEFTVATVGTESDELQKTDEGPHVCALTVHVKRGPELAARERAVEQQALDLVRKSLEVRTPPQVRRPTLMSIAAPIEIEVRGKDREELTRLADEIVAAVRTVPGVKDARSSLRRGKPELRITFRREELALQGIDLAQAARAVQAGYQGVVASQFNEGDRRVPIVVLAPEEERWGRSRLEELEIEGRPLAQLADLEEVYGPAEIRRIGNRRAAVVTVVPETFDLGGISDEIEAALLDVEAPLGYEVVLGGQKREMEQALGSLRFALLLAIFLVYVVMASQFESVLQPFLILGAVPLAGVGVIFALDLAKVPLSVVVFLGLIMLAGIVVNNAIVLIDRINQRREQGEEARSAILEAAQTRLRPILMTTLTTVLGLSPMLLAGEGNELRAPMALTVIAGLSSSTLLTLVVIPVLYSLVARFDRRGRADAAASAAEAST
ncbi:MAG: efflux RND transporter permease subunit [Planctomycetes bacterium]|nr:efflux RND transporter permease subunit [Planctomycetota bacterium]